MAVDVPAFGTPLLGREDEAATVTALLTPGDVRLVTITGPGGVGKTRLAVEVATRVGAHLRDGAVFVDLAGVTAAESVAAAIAQALDVGQAGIDEPLVALRRALADREVLLVLDNFEQVLAAAPVPATLLERCAHLRILVTSRAPLRVRAERVVRLPGLPVPGLHEADVETVGQAASVALFCERATAIRPEFALGDANAAAIAGICRAVDGLPLALELAAARITHLQPAVLLDRLTAPTSDAPLDTLGRGPGDLPARQRTMRDTIAWSYGLLRPPEQRLLRRLSIFDGDASLDAIESICSDDRGEVRIGSDGEAPLMGSVQLDALATLVDLHLLEPDVRDPDEARFGLLMTVREFGRELLHHDERQPLAARHAQYYATLVEQAAAGLQRRDAQVWARRLERELLEIRAALRHSLTGDDVVAGLRMAIAAGRFWLNQGHVVEGRQWLTDLMAGLTEEETPPSVWAGALMWAARLAMDVQAVGDPSESARLWAQLERARDLARTSHDDELELEALFFLTGILALDADDLERRLACGDEGIVLSHQLGNRWRRAELLSTTALLHHWAGHRQLAADLTTEACALADEVGNERLSIETRLTLSFVVSGTTRAGTAPPLAEVVPRAEQLGDKRVLAWLYPPAAAQAIASSRLEDAARWGLASLELARDSGYWFAGAFGLMITQTLAHVQGRNEAAARLSGVVSQNLATLRRGAPPGHVRSWERINVAIRESLGDDAFVEAAQAGAELSWDAALREAMTICAELFDEPREPPPTRPRLQRAPGLELTERELDVLRLIASGGTNKDVAATLGIRAKTVMHHSVAIYRKLGVRGRAEATAYAYRHHLIEAPEPA